MIVFEHGVFTTAPRALGGQVYIRSCKQVFRKHRTANATGSFSIISTSLFILRFTASNWGPHVPDVLGQLFRVSVFRYKSFATFMSNAFHKFSNVNAKQFIKYKFHLVFSCWLFAVGCK